VAGTPGPDRDESEHGTRFDAVAARLEKGALVVAMALLVGIAALQLVLRSVFAMSLLWADELLRILVLWLAVLGAIAAARTDRHLRIDVVPRLLPPRGHELTACAASLVVVGVAGLFAYEAARFMQQAWAFEDTVLGGLAPQWPLLLIMPVGLGLIAGYYLRNAWRHLRRALGREPPAR
jgi:TRAP-type C4-dicarboxylate transport system permease small subunit